jgi:hypothetical protein
VQATLSVPNAIVFILDPESRDVNIPEYDPDQTVASNQTCVSVKTLADVDGDATVRLEHRDKSNIDGLETVFVGKVATPNKRLAVVTSLLDRIAETKVAQKVTRVAVAFDDRQSPALIVVSFE